MTDRYAVVGNPVAHSKSPDIHAAFARQSGQDMAYTRLLAPLDGLRETLAAFRAAGGRGVNVTLPFKLEAFGLADDVSQRARQAGAANFLHFEGSRIRADNTDGVGLTRDIVHNLDFALAGRRVLILGAGGAARGVLAPILEFGPSLLTLANRTLDKALHLAEAFRHLPAASATVLRVLPFGELAGHQFDLVINATSSGLNGARLPLPAASFAPDALAYDLMYGPAAAPFLDFAAAQGARTADGLGMLVEQAAESFLLWRGVRPETAPVIAALRTS